MYLLFDMADTQGKTAGELLAGRPMPLTQMEFYLKQRWRVARARFEQQARPPGKR